MTRKLPPHEERKVAVDAEVDPKTVRRALEDPSSVRPLSLTRIVRALDHHGLSHLLRDHDGDDE